MKPPIRRRGVVPVAIGGAVGLARATHP